LKVAGGRSATTASRWFGCLTIRSDYAVTPPKVNPSARMPVTVYKQAWADAMNCKNVSMPANPGTSVTYKSDCNSSILHFDLETGVGKTHRYMKDASYIRHAFGFGLSYTSFGYSTLMISQSAAGDMNVTVTLTNTGAVSGAEVLQVYVAVRLCYFVCLRAYVFILPYTLAVNDLFQGRKHSRHLACTVKHHTHVRIEG
jgi:hypothetical protein